MPVMGRIRVYFDANEEVRLALKQEALRQNKSVSLLIEELVNREFPKSIEEAKKTIKERERKKAD